MDGTVATLADEPALVARAVIEPAAFGILYDHYFRRVYNYIRYRVRDGELSDDLTAQVFEKALTSIHRYNPQRAPFGAWLFAIARHAVSDYFRSRNRRRWLSLEPLHDWISHVPEPEERIFHEEECSQLLIALSCLSEREQDLIALKFAAGMPNCYIAKLTGLSESNVAIIIYRAVQKLRVQLTEKEQ